MLERTIPPRERSLVARVFRRGEFAEQETTQFAAQITAEPRL